MLLGVRSAFISPPKKPKNGHFRGVKCHFGRQNPEQRQPRGKGRGWRGFNCIEGGDFSLFPSSSRSKEPFGCGNLGHRAAPNSSRRPQSQRENRELPRPPFPWHRECQNLSSAPPGISQDIPRDILTLLRHCHPPNCATATCPRCQGCQGAVPAPPELKNQQKKPEKTHPAGLPGLRLRAPPFKCKPGVDKPRIAHPKTPRGAPVELGGTSLMPPPPAALSPNRPQLLQRAEPGFDGKAGTGKAKKNPLKNPKKTP